MTTVIALIGHLDGGGASTFCIVVPSMLPVYKKMHMRPTTLLRVSVLAMGVLNSPCPGARPKVRPEQKRRRRHCPAPSYRPGDGHQHGGPGRPGAGKKSGRGLRRSAGRGVFSV